MYPIEWSKLEKLFYDTVLKKINLDYVYPQHEFYDFSGKKRRIDFAIITLNTKLAIELDGYKYHARGQVSRTKFRDDLFRQNTLVIDGWKVLRFEWSEVFEQQDKCLKMIISSLENDDKLKELVFCDDEEQTAANIAIEFYRQKALKFMSEMEYNHAGLYFEKALNLNPFRIEIYAEAANAYYETGEYNKCIDNINMLMGITQESEDLLSFRDQCYIGILSGAKVMSYSQKDSESIIYMKLDDVLQFLKRKVVDTNVDDAPDIHQLYHWIKYKSIEGRGVQLKSDDFYEGDLLFQYLKNVVFIFYCPNCKHYHKRQLSEYCKHQFVDFFEDSGSWISKVEAIQCQCGENIFTVSSTTMFYTPDE